VNRIGIAPRLAAFLLDAALAAAVSVGLDALEISVGIRAGEALGLEPGHVLDLGPLFLLALLGVSLLEGVFGFGPGKLLLGLRVGYDDGGLGNLALYLGRWTVKHSGSLVVVLAMILGSAWLLVAAEGAFLLVVGGGGLAILGREHMTLHDRAVRSAVYRAEDLRAG
jgi:hypothetical protein